RSAAELLVSASSVPPAGASESVQPLKTRAVIAARAKKPAFFMSLHRVKGVWISGGCCATRFDDRTRALTALSILFTRLITIRVRASVNGCCLGELRQRGDDAADMGLHRGAGAMRVAGAHALNDVEVLGK